MTYNVQYSLYSLIEILSVTAVDSVSVNRPTITILPWSDYTHEYMQNALGKQA